MVKTRLGAETNNRETGKRNMEAAGITDDAADAEEDGASCIACLSRATTIRSLPCGHAMCSKCFYGLVAGCATMRLRVAGGHLLVRPKGVGVQCPLCRADASNAQPLRSLACVTNTDSRRAATARF